MSGHRFGYICVLGRPNVGKSTLVNQLVGTKVTITSRRPQTTRHRILGILSRPDAQYVFVDTPGIHPGQGKALNQIINQTARRSVSDVDVIVLMITADGWRSGDDLALSAAGRSGAPVVLAINKVDRLKNKSDLLPLIDAVNERWNFAAIVPVSAKTGHNLEQLLGTVRELLPEGGACFDADTLSDRNQRFHVGELIREQVFRLLGDELPYQIAIDVTGIERKGRGTTISADILVDRESQKGIVIGRGGEKLRRIGTEARKGIEHYLGAKVHLDLRVKVRSGWADSAAALRGLGYSEDV